MRKNELYQLYDKTARSVAGPIMMQKHAAPAIRDFHSILANTDTMPGRYPEQFDLLHVGTQDEETGTLAAVEPRPVATGAAWREARLAEEAAQRGEIPLWGETPK